LKKISWKKNKEIIIAFVLIGVFLILFLTNSGFLNFNKTLLIVPLSSDLGQCIGSQSSFFSIDKIDIVGQGSRFRIYGKVGGGSECMQIALSKEQLNEYLEGYQATKPLYGNIKLLKYTRTFPINPTNKNYISNLKLAYVDNPDTISKVYDSLTECKKTYPNTIYAYKITSLQDIRCIVPDVQGVQGVFSGISYDDLDLQVDLNGATNHFSRSHIAGVIGDNSILLSGGLGRFEWQGNLNNLNDINPPYQYQARLINSKYTLIDSDVYNTINSEVSSFKACMSSGLDSLVVDECLSQSNTALSGLLVDRTSEYESNIANNAYDVNTDTNALYVALKAPPFPTFILDVDAEWVGIVPLSGKPQLISCIQDNQKLQSGTPVTLSFNIKNNAPTSASFYGGIKCNQGVTGFINQFNINPNEQKQMTAEVIPSNPNEGDLPFSCTLTINDLKSSNQDTCTFTGTVAYVSGISCVADSLSCDNNLNNLLICSSDGKTLSLKERCNYGCEYKSGKAQCKLNNDSHPPPEELCKSCDDFALSTLTGWFLPANKCDAKGWTFSFWNPLPQNTSLCIVSFIKYIVAFFASIIAIFISQDLLEKIRSLKKNKPARWIVSILIGLGIGFMLYLLIGSILFYILLVVLIILLIFKSYLKKILRL